MSYSGRLQTSLHAGLKMTFDYTYTIDKSDREATVKWSISPYPYDDPKEDSGNAHYHLAKNSQKLTIKVSGDTIYSYNKGDSYTKNNHTVYRGYTDKGSNLDKAKNGEEFYDTNGNWTGVKRWVLIEGTDWLKGSFKVPYKSDGTASFYVKGDFAWWSPVNPTKRMVFEETVNLKTIEKQYSVKYHANGGDNAPSSQIKTEDKTLTLRSGKPTYTGNTFVGWSTSSTDTTTEYQPGGKYTKNAKLDLYAIWKHTITYNANKGTFTGTNEQTKYLNANVKLFSASSIKRPGYILNGWSTDVIPDSIGFNTSNKQTNSTGVQVVVVSNPNVSSKKSTVYLPGQTFADNSNKKLYASWRYQSNIPVTLKDYYSNNILVGDKKLSVEWGYVITEANKNIFRGYSKTGYKLLGWSKQKTEVYKIAPSASELKALLFDYNVKYTDDPVGITLYPVLQYETTCYVNFNGKWRLAVPYVNSNGKWRQAIMYVNSNGKWRL